MKLKIFIKLLFSFLVIAQLCSCIAVSVQDLDIDRIEISFRRAEKGHEHFDRLVPGEFYTVDALVYADGKSRPIKHPDYTEFNVECNNMQIVTQRSTKLRVYAEYPSGEWLIDGAYSIIMSISGNNRARGVKSCLANWAKFNRLSYKGRSGSTGSSGINGYNGGQRNGGSGEHGSHGENAPNVSLQAAFVYAGQYDMPDGSDRMVLLYSASERRTYLMSAANYIIIDVSGGDGGAGGNGGNGANGDSGTNRHLYPIDGGNGGNGGDGGDGGDGGHLDLTLAAGQNISDCFRINVSGGRGGTGGLGGNGGNGAVRSYYNSDGKKIGEDRGSRGYRGQSGRSGRHGRDGEFVIFRSPIDSMFVGCSFIAAHPEVREMMR